MAISAIVSGLGAIGITGTAATVGAVMLQGGLIGGTVNKIAGGSFSEGFLMGAITGGAEWAVSGALGAIAPSLGQLGNAIASSAIVAGATAAALGQKDWLKQGLIGGAAAGIFYQAVDWTTKQFSKPAAAKPGSLVTDAKGNVFLIDSAGKGVYQQDMFAIADDATKNITIVDTAGNVVNSTSQAAKPSAIYASTTAAGDIPPRVGLSTIGEIDGVAGTATYYTNGKATWTPINDGVGFGTSDLIDAGTIIRQDVTLDPTGVKPPQIDYTTASGYDNTRDMIARNVQARVNVDGVDGTLTNWTYGDDVISTFKPTGSNNYIDVTDTFGNKTIVDGRGYVYKDGIMQNNRITQGYVDGSGMVYDGSGNPVAKLASAVDNSSGVDWSGTLDTSGAIKRTNGDFISSETGKYLNGLKQGEFATDMTKSGQYYSKGNFNGKSGTVFDIGDGNLVFKPADGSETVGFQKNKVTIDYSGNIKEIAPSTPVDLSPTKPPSTDVSPPPVVTPKPPQVVPGSSQRISFDGDAGILSKLDDGNYKFSYMDTSKGVIDLDSSAVKLNAAGAPVSLDPPVKAIDIDGVGLSAKGTRLTGQNFDGNYVDASGMVYDDFGNPIAPIKNPVKGVDYEGTLSGGKITRVNGDTVDVVSGKITTRPVAPPPDVPAAPVKPPAGSRVDALGNVYDPNGTIIGRVNVPQVDGYQIGSRGQIYDVDGKQIGQLKSAAANPDLDYSGTLSRDGIITRTDGSAIDTKGTVVRPPADMTPVRPQPPAVDTTPVAPPTTPPATDLEIKPAPDATYTPPIDVAPPPTSGSGVKMTADEFSRLQNTQLFRNSGGIDIPTINSFIDQGYTPDQIIRAVENNPNGGWAGYGDGKLRSMTPGGDVAAPVRPTTPDVAPPVVDATPTRPVTPDVITPPVDTTPPVVDTTPTRPVMPEEPDVIEQIINQNRPTTPDITQPPVVDTTPPVVDTTPTRPVTPDVVAPPVDTTPPVVDTTPTRPVTPDVPPVDTTPPVVDTTPTRPVTPDVPAPPTTPDKPPGSNYVDSSGTLYDQYGNPTKDLTGNYVDKDGIVYDEFGNPAGDLTPGQNPRPGTDFSGKLNGDGTITKPDGSVIDYNGNVVKGPTAPDGPTRGVDEPDKPVTPDTPVKPGIVSPIVTAPALNQPETPAGRSYTLNWGTPPTINLPGVNPGIYAQAVKPYYTQGTSIQPQYYWGKHPYAATEADLANYNNIPGAPAQPFGAQFSAVGGNRRMDVNQFIQNYMDPQYQAGYLGSQPQFAGSPGTRSPIQGAPAGPVPPSAIPVQAQMQQPAQQFAAPARMNVQTGIGSLPPVSIPTWTKEGGLYYAMPTAAAV